MLMLISRPLTSIKLFKIFFLANLFSVPSIGVFSLLGVPGDFILPAIGIMVSALLFASSLRRDDPFISPLNYSIFTLISFLILKAIFYNREVTFRPLVDIALYYFMPLAVLSSALRLSRDSFQEIFVFLLKLALPFLVFGILQVLLYNYLPAELIYIPSTRGESTGNFINLPDRSLLRPNMLLGTAMVTGLWLVLMQHIVFLCDSWKGRELPKYIINILIFLIIILTFSRVAVLCYVVAWFAFTVKHQIIARVVILFAIVLVVLPVSGFVRHMSIALSLLERMTSLGQSHDQSTSMHLEDYRLAINTLIDQPVFGFDIGGAGDIITDGALFHYALDLGIIGLLIIFFFSFLLLVSYFIHSRRKNINWLLFTSCFICVLVFLIANSATLARINSSLIMLLVAYSFNRFRIVGAARCSVPASGASDLR